MQDEFGEPLYQRDGRGVRLTPAGEQLAQLRRAHPRDVAAGACVSRRAARAGAGTLRIGASTTPASYLLPYLIADFHRQFPDVTSHTIDGNTSDIVAALARLDIAMIEGPVGADLPPDTGVTPWREDEVVAIVPRAHPLAQASAGGRARRDIAPSAGACARRLGRAADRRARVRPRRARRCASRWRSRASKA